MASPTGTTDPVLPSTTASAHPPTRVTTLGRPGVQVAAITRRAEGYYIVHVESGEEGDYPLVNGKPIGPQARKLTDNDVVQLAGVKMGFFKN